MLKLVDALSMLKKAQTLIFERRVFPLSDRLFSVEGNHGVYLVIINGGGYLTCGCEGFHYNKLCSHVIAVSLVIENA